MKHVVQPRFGDMDLVLRRPSEPATVSLVTAPPRALRAASATGYPDSAPQCPISSGSSTVMSMAMPSTGRHDATRDEPMHPWRPQGPASCGIGQSTRLGCRAFREAKGFISVCVPRRRQHPPASRNPPASRKTTAATTTAVPTTATATSDRRDREPIPDAARPRVMITRVGLPAALIAAATVGTVRSVASQHSPHREALLVPRPTRTGVVAELHPSDGTGRCLHRRHWFDCRGPGDRCSGPACRRGGSFSSTRHRVSARNPARMGRLPHRAPTRRRHRAAMLDARAEQLTFVGGTGSCGLTTTSPSRPHHYRNPACLVQGAHGGSAVVAASLAADSNRYGPLLQQAVSAYSSP